MRILALTVPLFAILTLTTPAVYAVNWMFLEDSPAAHFTDEDWRLIAVLGESALEQQQDGEMGEWDNPESGNSGSITPVKSYKSADGQPCRKLKVVERAKGMVEESTVDLCKPDNGEWVLVTEDHARQ